MSLWEAVLLGIVQGLTEFLPVSSSGHIELGKVLLGIEEAGLEFSVVVHGATALSTLVVFRKDIEGLLKGLPAQGDEGREARSFAGRILLSMAPLAVVYVFFMEDIEARLDGHIGAVGVALMVTALLLFWAQRGGRSGGRLGPLQVLVIGSAQAIAVLPGISRSGATIATSLLLGVDREEAARFSFLMVLPPILGATALEIKDLWLEPSLASAVSVPSLIAAAAAAFLSGWWACRKMLEWVKRNGLNAFAVYCALAGALALALSFG
jgi:undecaprenyl-diphosphatase